eukprot:CAMPEP_0174234182 /NCGR_PEP_ID=MMETSP0417-20130205/4008_1 /TAXON_ID=242541 /ORGANISM="Mayorella sp, Strain BSH-02190019" /LENGTH=377 /DNA_ID=CAMNT_0015312511 /DNA_START=91 /DNA_END=1221 /DNA_ORIENTATION=+
MERISSGGAITGVEAQTLGLSVSSDISGDAKQAAAKSTDEEMREPTQQQATLVTRQVSTLEDLSELMTCSSAPTSALLKAMHTEPMLLPSLHASVLSCAPEEETVSDQRYAFTNSCSQSKIAQHSQIALRAHMRPWTGHEVLHGNLLFGQLDEWRHSAAGPPPDAVTALAKPEQSPYEELRGLFSVWHYLDGAQHRPAWEVVSNRDLMTAAASNQIVRQVMRGEDSTQWTAAEQCSLVASEVTMVVESSSSELESTIRIAPSPCFRSLPFDSSVDSCPAASSEASSQPELAAEKQVTELEGVVLTNIPPIDPRFYAPLRQVMLADDAISEAFFSLPSGLRPVTDFGRPTAGPMVSPATATVLASSSSSDSSVSTSSS